MNWLIIVDDVIMGWYPSICDVEKCFSDSEISRMFQDGLLVHEKELM